VLKLVTAPNLAVPVYQTGVLSKWLLFASSPPEGLARRGVSADATMCVLLAMQDFVRRDCASSLLRPSVTLEHAAEVRLSLQIFTTCHILITAAC
jgi:hypothetical protein